MAFPSIQFAIGISVFSIASSIAPSTFAAGFTATDLEGPALVYAESNGKTSLDQSDDYPAALEGRGNVELGGQLSNPSVANFEQATVLTGTVGKNDQATLQSLTRFDWFGEDGVTQYGDKDLANQWFGDLLSQTSLGSGLAKYNSFSPGMISERQVFDFFLSEGGFERFSDPNIASVNVEGNDLVIQLAGHENAANPVKSSSVMHKLYDEQAYMLKQAEWKLQTSYELLEKAQYGVVKAQSEVENAQKALNQQLEKDSSDKAAVEGLKKNLNIAYQGLEKAQTFYVKAQKEFQMVKYQAQEAQYGMQKLQAMGMLTELFEGVQISEVVRVDYAGETQYLYSFEGDRSEVKSDDGTLSHTANFTVVAKGTDNTADVPEPATTAALLLVGLAGSTVRKCLMG